MNYPLRDSVERPSKALKSLIRPLRVRAGDSLRGPKREGAPNPWRNPLFVRGVGALLIFSQTLIIVSPSVWMSVVCAA